MSHDKLLHQVFQINPEPMALSRLDDGRYIDVNLAFLRVFGYSREEVIGRTAQELGIWENAERDREPIVNQVQCQGYALDCEAAFITKGGTALQFLLGASRIDGEGGPLLLIVGRNVTELRSAEQALRDSEARYRSLTENLPLGIMIAQDDVIRYANPASLALLGYELNELIGQSFLPLIEPADRALLLEQYRSRMAGDDASTCYDLRVVRKDGVLRYGRIHSSMVTWEGRRAGLVAFSDITTQKLTEQKITEMALHDVITGLPNRMLLADRAHQAIVAATRRHSGIALLYLDLDGFKAVNDNWGHEAGDEVLRQVGERLCGNIRETDTAARVGGDEFVVLVQEVADYGRVQPIAEKLMSAINRPIRSAAGEHQIGVSIGIAMFPNDGIDLDCLMRSADKAMYRAKHSGRNSVRCYRGGAS